MEDPGGKAKAVLGNQGVRNTTGTIKDVKRTGPILNAGIDFKKKKIYKYVGTCYLGTLLIGTFFLINF